MKKKPQKPLRSVTVVRFGKNGTAGTEAWSPSREHLGAEQQVGAKFVEYLAGAGVLADVRVGPREEPGDVTVDAKSGRVLIQIAEAVDVFAQRLSQVRSEYREGLTTALRPLVDRLRGMRLGITDEGSDPLLPPVNSTHGATILQAMVDHVTRLLATLEANPTAGGWHLDLNLSSPSKRLFFSLEKYSSINAWPQRVTSPKIPENAEYCVFWSGGRLLPPGGSTTILNTVRGKIDKSYSKPSGAQFWLLVYSLETVLMDSPYDQPQIETIVNLLNSCSHSFDEVWFYYPDLPGYQGQGLRLWPRAQAQ